MPVSTTCQWATKEFYFSYTFILPLVVVPIEWEVGG